MEAIAIGITFAGMKDYQIDGNKEMVALGSDHECGRFNDFLLRCNSLYTSLRLPPFLGWMPSGGDPCADAWQAVGCVFNDITEIRLPQANLEGGFVFFGVIFIWPCSLAFRTKCTVPLPFALATKKRASSGTRPAGLETTASIHASETSNTHILQPSATSKKDKPASTPVARKPLQPNNNKHPGEVLQP